MAMIEIVDPVPSWGFKKPEDGLWILPEVWKTP